MTDRDTDIAPAPLETIDDSQYLDLGGIAIHGSREERREFFASLAKAQAGYAPIQRSRTVQVRSDKGNYTFDYAPLENVLEATMPSLNTHGLALLNAVSDKENGKELHTLLTHEGGAVLHMTMGMPSVLKPQDLGAQITYARRYSIQCVTGTSPEFDDDGNEGSGNRVAGMADKQRKAPEPPARPQQANGHRSEPPPPLQKAPERVKDEPREDAPTMITEEQATEIGQLFRQLQFPKPAAQELCKKLTGRTGQEMTSAMANVVLAELRSRAESAGGEVQ